MNERLRFTVLGQPQPKQRARKGKGGRFYTPKATVAYEYAVKSVAATMVNLCGGMWPRDAEYSVAIQAFCGDRRRRDLDNISKSVLDAMNGIAWVDDSQVSEFSCARFFDKENPRTEVVVKVVWP